MAVTSFGYLVLITIGALLYYLVPRRWQWVELLVISLVFYYCAATPYTILFLLISAVTAYVAGRVVEADGAVGRERTRRCGVIVAVAVGINIALWFFLKGSALWISLSEIVSRLLPFVRPLEALPIASALGMGYYTLQVTGYILDCYWGTIRPQRNFLKVFLFVAFFPQLTTGPISRYSQLEPMYEGQRFSYENISHGAQRILWGFYKKLVIAERTGIIVSAIWANLAEYTGLWHWIALLLYPIQLYADFSGGMDIVLGTAQIFGIDLPENFRAPFLSHSIQEFWQRWHITLGGWAREYVLYPLLKWRGLVRLGKKTKKRFGKRFGRFIPTAIGMLILWLVMGIWHGSLKFVLGMSLWYWGLMMLGELMMPVFQRMKTFLGIREESFSWRLFQSIRTYILYAMGAIFFCADSAKEALAFLGSLFTMFADGSLNPWILFDGSVRQLGVSYTDLNILVFSFVLLFVADLLRERYGYARTWMDGQNLVFRWMIWLGLFAFVLIYGMYGPGYSAAEFIYQGF